MSTKSKDITACNFCDATEDERKVMVARDIDTAICDICIVLCVRALADRDRDRKVVQSETV